MKLFDYIFKNEELPLWIRRLNYISLAGVIAWPLVAFGSLFMTDDPNTDTNHVLVWMLLLDAYPLYLLILSYASFKLFRFSPVASAILACIPIACYVVLLSFFVFA
jgi:hypothetical protein